MLSKVLISICETGKNGAAHTIFYTGKDAAKYILKNLTEEDRKELLPLYKFQTVERALNE